MIHVGGTLVPKPLGPFTAKAIPTRDVGVKFILREDLGWTTEGIESTEEEKEVFKLFYLKQSVL